MTTSPPPLLPHASLNPDCHDTILLLHGAFSNPCTWAPIAHHLPTYHLLIPLLPSDCNLTTTASRLASLLQQTAHSQRAHIVAFSLGTHFAVRFMQLHPEFTRDRAVLLCGYNRQDWGVFNTVMPHVWFGVESAGRALVRVGVLAGGGDATGMCAVGGEWAGLDAAVERQGGRAMTLEGCRTVIAVLKGGERVTSVPRARTLVVAARKGVLFVPSMDKVGDAKTLATALGHPRNRAVGAEGMMHPWGYTYPQLFAASVRAWIEETPLPDFLVDL